MTRVSPPKAFSQICTRARGGRFGIAFDYDGTLTELAPYPPLARLSDAPRLCLLDLAKRPGLEVAVITGRALDSLSDVAGELPGVALATNGGLRISNASFSWVHPDAVRSSELLREVARLLKAGLQRWPGAFVEDKELTLTVHFRQAPHEARAITVFVQGVLAEKPGVLRLIPGHMSLELQPAIEWDKGHALTTLLDQWGVGGNAVFFGDDTIDEPAFEALRKRGGLTYRVGESKRATSAEFQLGSVLDLLEVLFRLADSACPEL